MFSTVQPERSRPLADATNTTALAHTNLAAKSSQQHQDTAASESSSCSLVPSQPSLVAVTNEQLSMLVTAATAAATKAVAETMLHSRHSRKATAADSEFPGLPAQLSNRLLQDRQQQQQLLQDHSQHSQLSVQQQQQQQQPSGSLATAPEQQLLRFAGPAASATTTAAGGALSRQQSGSAAAATAAGGAVRVPPCQGPIIRIPAAAGGGEAAAAAAGAGAASPAGTVAGDGLGAGVSGAAPAVCFPRLWPGQPAELETEAAAAGDGQPGQDHGQQQQDTQPEQLATYGSRSSLSGVAMPSAAAEAAAAAAAAGVEGPTASTSLPAAGSSSRGVAQGTHESAVQSAVVPAASTPVVLPAASPLASTAVATAQSALSHQAPPQHQGADSGSSSKALAQRERSLCQQQREPAAGSAAAAACAMDRPDALHRQPAVVLPPQLGSAVQRALKAVTDPTPPRPLLLAPDPSPAAVLQQQRRHEDADRCELCMFVFASLLCLWLVDSFAMTSALCWAAATAYTDRAI